MGPDDEVKPLQGKLYIHSVEGEGVPAELVPLGNGDFIEVGYLNKGGLTPSFEVVDESHQWNAGSLKAAAAMTTSIQVKAPGTELYKLLYGSTAYADHIVAAEKVHFYGEQVESYVQGLAKQAAVPHHLIGFDGTKTSLWDYWAPPAQKAKEPVTLPATVALPTSVDDVPGEFPTVDIAGTPSAAKQQFIDQIGPCDGFELPPLSKEAAVKISKALKPGKVQIHMNVDTSSILASFAVMQKQINESAKKIAQSFNDFAEAIGPVSTSNLDRAEQLHRLIPGVDERVKPPCSHGDGPERLWDLIQHLNDAHNPMNGVPDPWSRERIADWLETLDVDLRVQDKPTPPAPETAGWHNSAHAGYEIIGAGKVTPELSIGDWVQDVSAKYVGDIGQIIQAKKAYDLYKDQNVIELKVRYANGGIAFLWPGQVEKVGPPGPGTNPWHSELFEGPKLSPGEMAAQLNIKLPPIGLADIVKHYLKPQVEGRVTQYHVDTNVSPAAHTFTVTWPDGTTSEHPREELILVEAYSSPVVGLTDWGSEKIATSLYPEPTAGLYFNNISPA